MKDLQMPWLEFYLPKKAMEHLWDSINNSPYKDARQDLVGNISKSVYIEDKDNWFYKNVLKGYIQLSRQHCESVKPYHPISFFYQHNGDGDVPPLAAT